MGIIEIVVSIIIMVSARVVCIRQLFIVGIMIKIAIKMMTAYVWIGNQKVISEHVSTYIAV